MSKNKKRGRNRQNKRNRIDNREPSEMELQAYHDAGHAVCTWLEAGVERATEAYAIPYEEEEWWCDNFEDLELRPVLAAGQVAVQIREGLNEEEIGHQVIEICTQIWNEKFDDADDLELLFNIAPYKGFIMGIAHFRFALTVAGDLLSSNWDKVKALATELCCKGGWITPERYAELFREWGEPPKHTHRDFTPFVLNGRLWFSHEE